MIVGIFIIVVIVLVIFICVSIYSYKKKKEELLVKYGDAEIVDKIMRGMFWQGQTIEQLLDSIGEPVGIDEKVFKAKSREVWKYKPAGKGRFKLRITIENGLVIGWDDKS